MNQITRTSVENLWSEDRQLQNKAFCYILEATDKPVDWAYDVWDEMLEGVINLARKEPVLLLTPDGKEFFISEADDFDREVETLRRSPTFQRFLDERSKWDLTSDSSAPQLGPTQSKPKGAQTC